MEHQVRARIRHHHLHRHRDVQRIRPRPETSLRIGVPQPVHPVPQPRPRRPSAQPEEPRVRRHLAALQPPRPRPLGGLHRFPPPGRQFPPQHHPARSAHLHRAVPGHRHRHPLRHNPPAAPGVRLQHGPRIRFRPGARHRVRRRCLRPVPAPEHRTAHPDPHHELRAGEPQQAPARPRLRTGQQSRHPRPLRAPAREPHRIRAPVAPGGQPRPPSALRTDVLDRTHQITTVHGDHPATGPRPRVRRSTVVHPQAITADRWPPTYGPLRERR